MATPKTLVVGSTGHQYVQCVRWKDIQSVNIVDFDLVVINTRPLNEAFLKKCKHDFFENIRISLSRFLKSSGDVIALGDKERWTRISDYTSYSNYSWSPIQIDTHNESGDTINIKNPYLTKYVSQLKNWNFYYSFPYQNFLTRELTKICGDPSSGGYESVEYKYIGDVEHYIENRYGAMLAGSIKLSTTYKKRHEKEKIVCKLGRLILFPYIDSLDERQAINIILEDILSLPQETLPPEWAEAVPMPLIGDIQTTIDEKKSAIESLRIEITALQVEKGGIETFKKLLYGSGVELEQIFALCIEKLGGEVIPAKYSQEEFILKYKGKIYLIECKGIGKSVALTHVRQLTDYILKFEEDEGQAGKGILLGNAWKELPLNERNQAETIIFPDNVITRAESLNIALVSSVNFFNVFCKFLEGAMTGEDILDKIVDAVGVVEFESKQTADVNTNS